MNLIDFDYDLPVNLIAQEPTNSRTESRLLVLDGNSGEYQDRKFINLIDILQPKDLLVFNDTKVIKARLFGRKKSGGKIEILIENFISKSAVQAQIKSSRKPHIGSKIILPSGNIVKIIDNLNDMFILNFDCDVHSYIHKFGEIPLPPYIKRKQKQIDINRYQTVYAKNEGAIAAPTAGLHFSKEYLSLLEKKDMQYDFLTLHVGAGTFLPIRSNNILEHKIHEERIIISDELCRKIAETKNKGGRVIAIGTTSLRALEAASASGDIKSCDCKTDLFIYPGYEFKIVDALLTNLHLPKSSLLLLVSAFAGKDNIFSAYKHGIKEKYRFFSYGDAMFIKLG